MFLSFSCWKKKYHFFFSKDQRSEIFFLKISFTKKKNKRAHDTGLDSIFPPGNKSYSSNQGATHLGSLITMECLSIVRMIYGSFHEETRVIEKENCSTVFFFFLNHDPLCLESDPWNGEKVKMYMRGLASLGARKLDGRNSSYREDFRLSRLIGVKRKHTQPRFNRPAKLTR